jgi:hypothetical protein
MNKRIFIGSSSKSKPVAEEVASLLRELDCEPVLWWDPDVFPASGYILDSLRQQVHSFDGGVFIFAEDDELKAPGGKQHTVRDNVLVEAGFFYANFGREAVGLCVNGHPKIPSDFEGITTIALEMDNGTVVETAIVKRRLSLWLKNVKHSFARRRNNVFMCSRKELHELYPFEERLGFAGGELYKQISNVRVLNLAGNLIINPAEATNEHKRQMDRAPVSLSEALWRIVEYGSAYVSYILAKPTPEVIKDASSKIANPAVKAEGAILSAHAKMYEMLTSDTVLAAASNSRHKSFDYQVVDLCIPFGMFIVEYGGEYSYLSHVKIDLYSAEISNENDRRSMVIWQIQDPENYNFFVNNYDAIKKSRGCETPTMEELSKWARRWQD